MAQTPTSVEIFSYQVGFGDCFLVRFKYPNRDRHILIDFGSTGLPKDADKKQLLTIAKDIAQRCGGKLEAVVATHRHADHISGFATNKQGTAPGDIICSLQPELVIQPWTEHPDLAKNALGPAGAPELKALHLHTQSLRAMHAVAQQVLDLTDSGAGQSLPKAMFEQLRFIGEDNLANASAVKNLMTMSKKRAYVYHGSNAGLGQLLPGVKVHVLGPPTLRQTDTIKKQRAKDPNEFWQLRLRGLTDEIAAVGGKANLFPKFPSQRGTRMWFSARWLANRMKNLRGEQLLQLVRTLDTVMNNTSVILLFQFGSKTLLFPGDAQIENWAYALSQPKTAKLLADVNLYKVGHHGSRNATPRSMWELFENRGPKGKKGRMSSLLSTMAGKHGSTASKTEVPRTSLLQALRKDTDLHDTQDLTTDQLFATVTL